MAVAFVRAAPPGPAAITAVTVVPLSLAELPFASWSWTTGCWANATPLWALPDGAVVSASFVAAPAVMVMVVDVADASPVAEKLNVRSPAVPVMARSVKLATPLPFVTAVSVPPRVPPPVAIAAVTVTSLWLTALPLASRTWITGC